MLHTAAGPKIDFKCLRLWKWRQWWNTFDNIGKCSSENYIWDCLLFWTNSFSSDSIPFFIKWKWMIGCIFHLFSVWWQKLLHHQFLFQEAEGLFFKRQLCNRKWLIQRKHFLQQKGCMYHDKKAWWRDIFMIQLQSFISQDCDFPWDASKSLLFPAPNSKFLSLTYDLHLLTCISVLIGIRLANKGCWKSAFI